MTTRILIQSSLYLALETSIFCLEKKYLVNLNRTLRIPFNENQNNGMPQIFLKFTFHPHGTKSPSSFPGKQEASPAPIHLLNYPWSRGRGAVANTTGGKQQTTLIEPYNYPEVCPRHIYSCLNQNLARMLCVWTVYIANFTWVSRAKEGSYYLVQ